MEHHIGRIQYTITANKNAPMWQSIEKIIKTFAWSKNALRLHLVKGCGPMVTRVGGQEVYNNWQLIHAIIMTCHSLILHLG